MHERFLFHLLPNQPDHLEEVHAALHSPVLYFCLPDVSDLLCQSLPDSSEEVLPLHPWDWDKGPPEPGRHDGQSYHMSGDVLEVGADILPGGDLHDDVLEVAGLLAEEQ